MKVTVATENDTFTLDVPEDLELENFKAFCEVESVSVNFIKFEINIDHFHWLLKGLPASQTVIVFNNNALTDDKKTLNAYGIKEGDIVQIAGRAQCRSK